MPMLPSDRLLALPRGTADRVINYFNDIPEYVERWFAFVDYTLAVFDLAPKAGIDPAIVIAQASHETGKFTSFWWKERLNPAGIGITGDNTQNYASRTFKTGREAARAHLSHLQLYATGNISSPFVIADDPRYQAYREAYGNKARASTISDLAGTWAVDNTYASGVCRHGNEIFPNLVASSQPAPQPAPQPQPTPAPTTTAPNAIVYNGQLWTGTTDALISGKTYHGKRMNVTTSTETNVRMYADTSSQVLRTLPANTTFFAYGWVRGESVNGEDRWWIGSSYGRVWVGGTREKP